ncbi:hypothetical protein Hoch_3209 [Haliangium ochraceum DSM 14365]|uniref:Uncharacterized protein n=2 Tax=Haliangium ochraceum TaxID=80816 RepID=D0LTL7_HALO1|nr:hypothetical protein Hoch_3209 [Haliangium ochraceum DSM 14365]
MRAIALLDLRDCRYSPAMTPLGLIAGLALAAVLGLRALRTARARRALASQPQDHIGSYLEQSQPAADAWRWRPPSEQLGLLVEDRPGVSVLRLPRDGRTRGYAVFTLFGYVFAAIGLDVLLASPLIEWPSRVVLCCIWFLLAWVFLHGGAHVRAIELRPGSARLVLRYGVWLSRRVRYRAGCLHARGRLPSEGLLLSESRDQRYELFLSRREGGPDRRLMLHDSRAVGAWVVGGLNHWSVSTAAPRLPVAKVAAS